jgi:hypothetical protein
LSVLSLRISIRCKKDPLGKPRGLFAPISAITNRYSLRVLFSLPPATTALISLLLSEHRKIEILLLRRRKVLFEHAHMG